MILLGTDSPTDGRIAFLMAIATVIGGAGQYVVGLAITYFKERKADKGKSEATIVDHLKELVKRLDAEKLEQGKEKEEALEDKGKLIARVSRLEVRTAAMRSHIRYLESVLARNGHSFEGYTEPPHDGDGDGPHTPDGSAVQTPLPPPKANKAKAPKDHKESKENKAAPIPPPIPPATP